MLIWKQAKESHQACAVPFLRREVISDFPMREVCRATGLDGVMGDALTKEGDAFTVDYVLPTTEPSNSDRLSITEGERKW